MNEIYFEVMGNKRYSVFECTADDITMYNITISENNIQNTVKAFSSNKKKAIEFVECLIINYVSAVHINEIAYDYIS